MVQLDLDLVSLLAILIPHMEINTIGMGTIPWGSTCRRWPAIKLARRRRDQVNSCLLECDVCRSCEVALLRFFDLDELDTSIAIEILVDVVRGHALWQVWDVTSNGRPLSPVLISYGLTSSDWHVRSDLHWRAAWLHGGVG